MSTTRGIILDLFAKSNKCVLSKLIVHHKQRQIINEWRDNKIKVASFNSLTK